MTFDVLIIGLGQIGMKYDINLDIKKYVYSHASALYQHQGFNIIGGVDENIELRQIFEKKYNKKFYNNTIDALQENQPDIVVIATSTQTHKKILYDIIKYSQPKVILCEKPLSYTLQEAYEMHELCKKNKIELFVNYVRNSDPNVIEVHKKINSGEYAGPVKGVVWYSKGLLNNGSHFINLMEYWLGPVIKNNCINKGRLIKLDSEPDFSLIFKNGEVIFLSTKEENFSYYSIEMIFDNGRLNFGQNGENVFWTPVHYDKNLPNYRVLSLNDIEYFTKSMDKYQLNVTNELYSYLINKKYNLCSGEMAIATLETIQRITKECQ